MAFRTTRDCWRKTLGVGSWPDTGASVPSNSGRPQNSYSTNTTNRRDFLKQGMIGTAGVSIGAMGFADRKTGFAGGWARWELAELAVNQSILRWRRVRLRVGTWGGERLRRKGELPARIEERLAVWGKQRGVGMNGR